MQRPPRPNIKSAQILQFSNFRKVITPDYAYLPPQLNDMNAHQNQQCIKSMRDTNSNTEMHRSLNQVQNIQYLQISKKSTTLASKVNFNVVSGCSFKIRNFTNCRTRGIKQNSLVPFRNMHKPSSSTVNTANIKCIRSEVNQQIKLKNYPHNLQLTTVGSKIAYHKVREGCTQIQLFDEWAIIISQSLFYGSLLQQINLMKLKNLAQSCIRQHPGITVIIRLHSQRNIGDILSKLVQKDIKVCYIIWGKHKYFQTVNSFDLSEIANQRKINKFIIMDDAHQIIQNLYYQCRQNQPNLQQGQSELKLLNYSIKYAYLKFNGLPSLMRFVQKFKISINTDGIFAQKFSFSQQTQRLFYLEQLKQKIKLAEWRKQIKKPQTRKNSQKKSLKNSQDLSQKDNQVQRNQQFKKKIIQYAKILQQQHKSKQLRHRSIEKKQSFFRTQSSSKTGPLKLLTQRAQTPSNSRSSHQIISELLKNNAQIHKQILKYQQKTIGLNMNMNQINL